MVTVPVLVPSGFLASAKADVAEQVVPAPLALAGLAAFGMAAVFLLPEAAVVLPTGGDPEPNPAQLALTCAGILAGTAAYLLAASRRLGLPSDWLGLAFGYNAAIAVIKFILSPASYHNRPETTLSEYLGVGAVVMVFYCLGLWAVFAMARRRALGEWTWPSKLLLVVGVLVLALASRYLAVLALGTEAADYLRHVFRGAGLWLPALLALTTILAVQTFERAAASGAVDGTPAGGTPLKSTLAAGLALVVLFHGLWALLMLRLFS